MLKIYKEGFFLLSDNSKVAKITALSDKTFRFQPGGTQYNGLHGQASPKRVLFSSFGYLIG